jgi:2-hydroxycyclohexanecarboxyl-CoA dehydrogenase
MTGFDFGGKTVLLTGATSGAGLAIARTMAIAGATVTVCGRSPDRVERARASLRELSPASFALQGDAGDHDDAARIVAEAAQHMGGLDILVSAGAEGTVKPTPFAEMTPEQLRAAFESRFFPRIYPVHAAIPRLRERGGGAIVMLTTDAARHPTPGESMIGAAGASVVLLTKALARELSRWSIRVNSLAMTLTSGTPSWDRIFGAPGFENKLFTKALERFPSGRAPTAEEVAQAAAFLASDAASQITGQTLSVNGGLSFGGW